MHAGVLDDCIAPRTGGGAAYAPQLHRSASSAVLSALYCQEIPTMPRDGRRRSHCGGGRRSFVRAKQLLLITYSMQSMGFGRMVWALSIHSLCRRDDQQQLCAIT